MNEQLRFKGAYNFSMAYIDLIEIVPNVKPIIAAKYLTDLVNTGHFKYTNELGHDLIVQMTFKGISAYTGDYFENEQWKVLWTSIMNISLTLANILVAITAIIALTKNDSQIEALQSRLTKVEAEVRRIKQTPPVLNQTKILDSSKNLSSKSKK